jgi:hypothetical protein
MVLGFTLGIIYLDRLHLPGPVDHRGDPAQPVRAPLIRARLIGCFLIPGPGASAVRSDDGAAAAEACRRCPERGSEHFSLRPVRSWPGDG